MATPQATAMGFNDYQTALALVNSSIAGQSWAAAYSALASARVILAGMPETVLTGQQMTRMRSVKDLDSLQTAITQAQIAATGGGGMGVGLFGFGRVR